MNASVAVLLSITVCAAESEHFSHFIDGGFLCDDDSSCPSGKYCAENKVCASCYRCSEYNREELDLNVRNECIKSAKDCGKCLFGFEMERCSYKSFCNKCVKAQVESPVNDSALTNVGDRASPPVLISLHAVLICITVIVLGLCVVQNAIKKRHANRGSGENSRNLSRSPDLERGRPDDHSQSGALLQTEEFQRQSQTSDVLSEDASSRVVPSFLPTAAPLSSTEANNAERPGEGRAPPNRQPKCGDTYLFFVRYHRHNMFEKIANQITPSVVKSDDNLCTPSNRRKTNSVRHTPVLLQQEGYGEHQEILHQVTSGNTMRRT